MPSNFRPDSFLTDHPPAETHPADQPQVNYSVALKFLGWMFFWIGLFAFERHFGFSAGVGEITASKDLQYIVKMGLFWVPIAGATMCLLYGLWALFPKVRPHQP